METEIGFRAQRGIIMRNGIVSVPGIAILFFVMSKQPLLAQQEVYHPGETYDSLQAGRDAYWDAEAERRAKIGRQLMLEEQIQAENTWSDPRDKYRPVHPESYGPIRPKVYVGPTLADVYGYPSSGITYYNAQPAASRMSVPGAAPVPVFEPWPRVPGDIWGTPYYGYTRQPIGHVKIWTGRLSYIYKPIYASPAMEEPAADSAQPTPPLRSDETRRLRSPAVATPPRQRQIPPPPPRPSLTQPVPAPASPAQGQEI
jgi:hypothetical protein